MTDACDPTVQLCDGAVYDNSTANATNETTSLFKTISTVGLPVVGAIQLSAGVITYLGSVSDGDTGKAPANYQLYQSIINGVFGTAGVALGVLGLMGGKAPEEEVPEEEAPVEGEEEMPALRQAEEEAEATAEETELAPVEEESEAGMPLG
jgi:hypothetical protein